MFGLRKFNKEMELVNKITRNPESQESYELRKIYSIMERIENENKQLRVDVDRFKYPPKFKIGDKVVCKGDDYETFNGVIVKDNGMSSLCDKIIPQRCYDVFDGEHGSFFYENQIKNL